jgi:hypothetical protein
VRLWALGQLDTRESHDPSRSDSEDDELNAAAAAFGLRLADPLPERKTLWLWPETVPFWNAWHQVQSQWRWVDGMSAPRRVGLDYTGVERWLRAHGWGHRRHRSLRRALDAISAAEDAALIAWNELAKTKS